MDVTVRLFLEW